MAKRRATAKQLAARKKFVAAVRRGDFLKGKKKKSSPKRRRNTTSRAPVKIKRKASPKRNMAKKRSSPRKKSLKVPILSNPTFKKAAAGVGAGTLLTFLLGAVGQGQLAQNPVVKAGAGFATGDVVGAAASFLIGGGLGNLTGSGNGSSMEGLA